MRVQADGDLEVSLGETVTIAIEAIDTAFLASTGPIQLGQWSAVPSEHQAGRFEVSPKFSLNFSFTAGFDFSINAAGNIPRTAKYRVRISGDGPGGAVREKVVRPAAILPSTRVFSFEVGQG